MSLNKFLKFHGKSATVRNFSSTGTDSYGDTTTSSSTSSTQVILNPNFTESDVNVGQMGQDVRLDAEILVDDEETIRDGEDGNFPTEIDVDSITYEVITKYDWGNGYIHCLVKRV